MATPHRGLPPPAGMALPAPSQAPPPVAQPVPLPNPPSQWQGDSMRNWLQAKTEDDRRRQEEEKTRQETIRLEVRKVEYSMLRESIAGGVPPHMIPMVFAGISGGNLANMSIEWAQHYVAQMQQQQQQQQQQQHQMQFQALTQGQHSPEIRRETRMITQQPQYGTPPQSMTTGSITPQAPPPPAAGSQPQTATFLSYQISPTGRPSAKQTPQQQQQQPPQQQQQPPQQQPQPQPQQSQQAPPSASFSTRPGPSTPSNLPRLNTDELLIQPPPQPPTNIQLPPSGLVPMPSLQGTGSTQQQPQPQPQPQQQQAPNTQEQASSSPIYFHHWVPPGSQAGTGSNQPTTPSAKSTDSPFPSAKRASHFGDPDYTSSPKKRKGQGGQAAVPAGSQAQPQHPSPQFPQTIASAQGARRRGHSRNRSDSSIRGHDSYGRPASRQRRSEGGAGSQGESSSSSRAPQGGTATTGAEDNGSRQSPLQHETRPDETRD